MNELTIDLDPLLKRLTLANTRHVYKQMIERAEKEQWSYHQFLATLVTEEIAHRQGTRLQRRVLQAKFPFLKTIEQFDFTFQSTLRLQMMGSYLSLDFVTEGRNLVLSGRPGRGKTHLAVAIAYRAIQNGFTASFVTAAMLIEELSEASQRGKLRAAVNEYVRPEVLVIDEVGYLAYGQDAANVLFHLVNERHKRRRSMVLTTNKSLGKWGKVLHDEDLAEAIIDRILERGRVLTLDGLSVRTSHLGLDEGQPGAQETSDRFSGKTGTDFPEPTRAKRDPSTWWWWTCQPVSKVVGWLASQPSSRWTAWTPRGTRRPC